MKKLITKVAILLLFLGNVSFAEVLYTTDGQDLTACTQGGTLSNVPGSDWWYGCAATSAGMAMAYYDINGYDGLSYDNLVPGGTSPLNMTGGTNITKDIIASHEHQYDFYNSGPGNAYDYDTGGGSGFGYNASGDDLATRNASEFNCLADFMGTSQDAYGNSNGATTIFNYSRGASGTGAQLTAQQLIVQGYGDNSGMVGIKEYIEYCGYSVNWIYNQYIDAELTGVEEGGFTFDNFKNEIDSGRVVIVHFTGHTMFGYGYDDTGIFLRDTWGYTQEHADWGGTYSGMDFLSVTCFEISGGSTSGAGGGTPEPGSIILMGMMICFILSSKCKKRVPQKVNVK